MMGPCQWLVNELSWLTPKVLLQMIDTVTDNLSIFLYSDQRDVVWMRSETLRLSSMQKYAPKAMRRYEARNTLDKIIKMTQGVWSQARRAVPAAAAHQAVDQTYVAATKKTTTFCWTFERLHHSLNRTMDNRQVKSTDDKEVRSALAGPMDKETPQYFEVKIENCDDACSIRIGFFIVCDKTAIERVPKRFAASQHKDGWLFNCKNNNVVNNSIGFECIEKNADTTVQRGSTVGVLVDANRQAAWIYLNRKRLTPGMPLSNEAKTAMAKAKSELFFCVDLDSQKHCVTITNSELPHG